MKRWITLLAGALLLLLVDLLLLARTAGAGLAPVGGRP